MRPSTVRFNLPLVLSITALLAATAAAQAPSDSVMDVRELLQKARGSIVVITGEDRTGQSIPPALGFVIYRNLIATNNRVIALNARLHASLAGQEPSSSINISFSDSYRKATIMTAAGYLGAVPMVLGDSDRVAAKDHVYLFADANPQGEILEAKINKVASIDSKRYFVLSTPLNDNTRGGPVFNNKGEVIAILAESPDGSHSTIAIPASNLTVLLKARTPELPSGARGDGPEKKTTTGEGYGTGSGGGGDTTGRPGTGPGQSGAGEGIGPGRIVNPTAASVTTRPRALTTVRPQYNETARFNQTQGVVMMRILVGADGRVKSTRVTKGLPDGLNEQATSAAMQLNFQPAMRDGVAVDYTVAIQVEFNLR